MFTKYWNKFMNWVCPVTYKDVYSNCFKEHGFFKQMRINAIQHEEEHQALIDDNIRQADELEENLESMRQDRLAFEASEAWHQQQAYDRGYMEYGLAGHYSIYPELMEFIENEAHEEYHHKLSI